MCLKHYFSDNWIYEVITGVEGERYKYLSEVVLKHHSPVLEAGIDKAIADDVVNEMNMFFVIDNHTFIHTKRYRDYETELLNKFIKDNRE
jgi:ATP adenylyltransferase/5',5'''-P-1,P-4-tetraphosphate phosphorylase II